MRIRKLTTVRLACVAAFAGLALLLASPAWAGQVGMTAKTTVTTLITTDTGTVANTSIDTSLETLLGTVISTDIDTVLSTGLLTQTGSIGNTSIETSIVTQLSSLGPFTTRTLINTQLATDTGTMADTAINTLVSTSLGTLLATGINTGIGTNIVTETGSIANTSITTILETVLFTAAPGDVSIEISQEGLNLTSPYDNVLKTGAILNKVGVNNTSGLTQVAAQSGNANVAVGSNSILDGPNAVAAKEIGVLTLVPGFALQNSTKATTAHIAGLALAAASATADQACNDIFCGVQAAVEIDHSDINEYSPHGNTTLAAALVENVVGVSATSGVTQVQAQAGGANVAGSHNLLLINGTFNGNGSGLNLNR
jgi:hypothetical protein